MASGLNRMGDNREYKYKAYRSAHRQEFSKIVDWIPKGSRVLDLGCGEGSLLRLLVEKKKAQGGFVYCIFQTIITTKLTKFNFKVQHS
jgi:ubiquinone/menaquinone biosynthesis C-methylase UbiE